MSTPIDRIIEALDRRVAIATESQAGNCRENMLHYLNAEIIPELTAAGFTAAVHENPKSTEHPLLVAQRIESPDLPTVLLYGHADVQFAHPEQWRAGLDPWKLTREGDRLYGRGSADNKGQHTVNHVALADTIAAAPDNRLGYNVTVLLETAEESGSLGLRAFAEANRDLLAADLFIGSDGPRYAADAPTIFLGSRGCATFDLVCDLRAGGNHSGNWGGKLRNPATVIAAAINALVDGTGRIRPAALRPGPIPDSVRATIDALPDLPPAPDDPAIDPAWGEPGLTPDEKVLGFNVLEVLAFTAGDPDAPVNAIPGSARAVIQLRYVVGTDDTDLAGAVRRALADAGITGVEVSAGEQMNATRLDPEAPAARAAARAVRAASGTDAAIEPNLGGTIPNDVFAEVLNLPTVWLPHSYPGCNQHAPNEHALVSILESGYAIMREVFADLSRNPADWFGDRA
jgi:acetylornithine deacetylase/succinyl-diaminopimelate desuccinylase-like protein